MNYFLAVSVLVLSIYTTNQLCYAEPPSAVCTGYRPDDKEDPWGKTITGTTKPEWMEGNCPEGQAIFSVLPPGGERRDGSKINIFGSCCPLPEGMLSNQHVYHLKECPMDHVATGAKQEIVDQDELLSPKYRNSSKFWRNSRLQYLRCTKIDTTRFVLGEASPGLHVGNSSSFRTAWEAKTSRSRIPLGLRFGLGRYTRNIWASNLCVALPWGSILTRRESKYCDGFYFSQVLYRGAAGDPKSGTAVPVYPKCLALENPIGANPKCIPPVD